MPFRLSPPVLLVAAVAAGALLQPLAVVAPLPARAAEASSVAPAAPAARLPAITVSPIVKAPISDSVIVTGTLVAREEVLVAAQIDGLAITEILVEEGARVAAGEVLARLSRETIEASLAQNAAQIARAEAAIAQARSQIAETEATRAAAQASFNRTRQLREEGITSAETFDQRQAAAQQAVARVNAAQQTLRLAEADRTLAEAQRREWMIRLGRTEIKAPTAGIVSRRTARLGAIAATASDPLFRIIRDGDVELEADVAETVLARIAIGQRAVVRSAGHGGDLPARVRLVAPEIARATRLGRVRLALEPNGTFAIGSFARGTIEIARREALVAPLSAVLFGAAGARVQVVTNGVVETRPVTVGIRAGNRIEIVEGVTAGEQVVTISGTFLRAGDRVQPVQAE
jgi:RND family efflux transporter MFP subunit